MESNNRGGHGQWIRRFHVIVVLSSLQRAQQTVVNKYVLLLKPFQSSLFHTQLLNKLEKLFCGLLEVIET